MPGDLGKGKVSTITFCLHTHGGNLVSRLGSQRRLAAQMPFSSTGHSYFCFYIRWCFLRRSLHPFFSNEECKMTRTFFLLPSRTIIQCVCMFGHWVMSDSFVTPHPTPDCNPPGSTVHGFPRQEYWSGLSLPTPRDPPNPGIKHASPALAGGFFTTGTTWEAHIYTIMCKIDG